MVRLLLRLWHWLLSFFLPAALPQAPEPPPAEAVPLEELRPVVPPPLLPPPVVPLVRKVVLLPKAEPPLRTQLEVLTAEAPTPKAHKAQDLLQTALRILPKIPQAFAGRQEAPPKRTIIRIGQNATFRGGTEGDTNVRL